MCRRAARSAVGKTGLLLVALAAVGLDVGTLAAGSSEVLLGLTLGGASEEEGVGAGRGLHDELVKSKALAASLGDAGTGSLGEAEGSNVELGHVEDTLIVSHSADNNDGSLGLLAKVLDDLGNGDGRSVGAGSNKSAEHGLGERRVGSASKESEQLRKS